MRAAAADASDSRFGEALRLGREMLRVSTGRSIRLAALAAFVVGMLATVVVTARWLDAGIDGILSGRPTPDGFVIGQLRDAGPAQRAGLRPGDLIIARDGVPATDRQTFFEGRRIGRAGQDVTLAIRRAGDQAPQTIELRLAPTLSFPDELGFFVVLLLVTVFTQIEFFAVIVARPVDPAARLLWVRALLLTWAQLLFMWDKAVGAVLDPPWHFLTYRGPLVIGQVILIHLFLVFPSPHPLILRARAAGQRLLRLVVRGAFLLLYLVPTLYDTGIYLGSFPDPLALTSLQTPRRVVGEFDPFTLGGGGLIILQSILGALLFLALVAALRRERGAARRTPLVWMTVALVVQFVPFFVGDNETLAAVTGGKVGPLPAYLTQAAHLFLNAALGLAVLRYGLVELNPVLRGAVLYPLIIAVAIAIYDVLAAGVARIATTVLGPDLAANPIIAALPVLIVLALLRPVRRQIQELLERRLRRTERAGQQLVAEISAALERGDGSAELNLLLTRRTAQTLGLSGAWLVVPDGVTGTSTAPTPAPAVLDALADGEGIAQLYDPDRVPTALAAWHEAGARLFIPIRVSASRRPIAVWVLGDSSRGDRITGATLHSLSGTAREAVLSLSYARLSSLGATS